MLKIASRRHANHPALELRRAWRRSCRRSTTDANGVATVPITLPDNLTRYRIVVVAVAGAKQIGHGEAALTARLPLMASARPRRASSTSAIGSRSAGRAAKPDRRLR